MHGKTLRSGRLYRGAAAALVAFLLPVLVLAQAYPAHPIRLIVPFAAGGGTDLFGRIAAAKLSEILGQQVVVDNRTGAGGNIGAELASKAPADGYTLLLGHTGTLAINPALYTKIAYDPMRDFAPVSLIAQTPLVLVVPPSVPATSVSELIALAKSQPGKLNFASSGNGTGEHLSAELFRSMAGVDIMHIPYNGSAPAYTALLAGQVQMFIGVLPPLVPMIKAGKLRAIGVTSSQRSAALPDVPTIAESGLPGYESILHFGVLAPVGTPQAIVDKLNAAIVQAMAQPDVQKKLADAGATAVTNSPAEYRIVMQSELDKWAKVVKASGAHVE